MALICLDTSVLVWGVASKGNSEMIERAEHLLTNIMQNGHRIMVPSIVLGEYLLALPALQHTFVINQFNAYFLVPAYDAACTATFATIWQQNTANELIDALKQDGATRTALRADSMIVATAITHGASIIYSNDKRLRRFAEPHIQAEDIPELPLDNHPEQDN